LLNRRGFDESLERAVAAAQEARSPITIVVVDCDDFKDVNDRAGHDFGDALLRELGVVLGELVGADGCPARLGGDEFAAVLADVDADDAGGAAGDLLQRLHAGLAGAGFPVRLSAGVATYPYDGAGTTQLKRAADQALYAAKGSGKGRATAFRDLVRASSAPRAVLADRRARDPERSPAVDLLDATSALWAAESTPAVLEVLARSLPYPLGAAGCAISRVEDGHIQEVTRHALRDVWLGEPVTYLLSDFPVTEEVVHAGVARAISFLDDDLDRAEAFVLRELGMSCCLLLPLRMHGASWGIAEVYDRRHRRFTEADEATAELLTRVAARRIEALGDDGPRRRLLPVVRPRRPD
jgi:diguanylate cyclase (GGDEF)-like protein